MSKSLFITLAVLLISQACCAGEPSLAEPFALDGLRYVKTLHKKEGVPVLNNNGVSGPGLMLSYFGRLDTEVVDAFNLHVDEVVLSDGTALSSTKIRTKSPATKHRSRWGIALGLDHRSVGIQIDLGLTDMVNIRKISGRFTAVVPSGSEIVETGLLEDRAKSSDEASGVVVEISSNLWNGRYFLLRVPNLDKVQKVTVLDEKGNELEQSMPLQRTSNNGLKLYVKKPKGEPFRLRLDMAKEAAEVVVPFAIGPVVFGK